MIGLVELRKADVMSLKNFLFATVERLWKQLPASDREKLKSLWETAKDNVGCRSCVFLENKWRRFYEDKNMLANTFVSACVGSLENNETLLRTFCRHVQMRAKTFIHPILFEEDFRHVKLDLLPAAQKYRKEIQRTVLMFYKEEGRDQTPLMIAADMMEDEGLTFETQHLRSDTHGLSCPLVLHILKEIR